MAKIQTTHSYTGKATGEVYQAVLQAVPNAGLEVWKRRDIAWLAMVRGGNGVDGNISVRPGVVVTVSLSAPRLSEEDLQECAQAVFQAVSAIVG